MVNFKIYISVHCVTKFWVNIVNYLGHNYN